MSYCLPSQRTHIDIQHGARHTQLGAQENTAEIVFFKSQEKLNNKIMRYIFDFLIFFYSDNKKGKTFFHFWFNK